MKKTFYLTVVVVIMGLCIAIGLQNRFDRKQEDDYEIKHVTGIILYKDDEFVVVEDENKDIYEFPKEDILEKEGTEVSVDYKDKIEKPKKEPSTGTSTPSPGKNPSGGGEVLDYTVTDKSKIPDEWLDGGLFSAYYTKAYNKLQGMSLDEKIGQTLLVRHTSSTSNQVDKYKMGGFVFFEVDFKNKSRDQVINMINSIQSKSSIPLIMAIDEEGGRVSRISSNPNLTSTPFKSPQDLYAIGGFEAILADVENKSLTLKGLGLNLNFAPVVDVSTDPSNYIYSRTLGQGTDLTSTYASKVIKASKGLGVSYTLKHFPGYGSNTDTHMGSSISKKSYEALMNEDIPPFREGINAGAEAVMVSHNVVYALDKTNESSISPTVHKLLRDDLKFRGVIITDDISMGAMKNVSNIGGKAINAGNDLIITSDVDTTFNQIKSSIANGSVKEEVLDRAVFRVLAWKYYKGLLMD